MPRPFCSALLSAGCLLLAMTALPQNSEAQRPANRATKAATPAARPSPSPSVAPVPAEAPSRTPAPDAESAELSPPTDDPEMSDTTETDINATESASFSSRDRIAVFNGNVKVTDPRFQLVCDKLTVFLSKPAAPGQNAAATPSPTPTPTADKKGDGGGVMPSGGSGIDHARAEGHVIILQKKAPTKPGEEEKISIGRGEVGTFDNKTGDMVLTGWPSLEQNGSSLVADAEYTVMTIHRDSSLNTEGPSKTRLIQHGKGGGSAFDLPGSPTTPTANPRKGNGNAAPAAANPPGARSAAPAGTPR